MFKKLLTALLAVFHTTSHETKAGTFAKTTRRGVASRIADFVFPDPVVVGALADSR